MKLNYRDKVILIGAIVALVWVAGIFLFIKPAVEDVNKAQDTLKNKTAELKDLNDKIEKQKDLPEKIDKAYKELNEVTDKFYSYEDAQSVIEEIDKKLDDADLKNKNATISEYTAMTFSPYRIVDDQQHTTLDKNVDDYKSGKKSTTDDSTAAATAAEDAEALVLNTNDDGTGEIMIGTYDVNLTFTGSKDDIKKFCQNLVSDKTLLVSNLSIPDVTDSKSESTATLKMIVVKKLEDPNKIKEEDKNKDDASSKAE